MALTTCWTLINGAAAGDRTLADEFVRTYTPVLTDYLSTRWKISPSDQRVSEALQCIFLDCLRPSGALQRVDPSREGGFRAFLYGVARNTARNLDATRAREFARSATPSELEELHSDDLSAEKAFDQAWARMMVGEALKAMLHHRGDAGEIQERVLRLRYFEGFKARQIAEHLGLQPDQVYQMLHRARRNFQSALLSAIAFRDPGLTQDELAQRALEMLNFLE